MQLLLFPINSFARKEKENNKKNKKILRSFSPSLSCLPPSPKKRIPIIENPPQTHETPPLISTPSSCLRFRVSIRPESPSRFPSRLSRSPRPRSQSIRALPDCLGRRAPPRPSARAPQGGG